MFGQLTTGGRMKKNLLYLGSSFLSLLFPPLCCACKKTLPSEDHFLCVSCLHKLPVTRYYTQIENPLMEKIGARLRCRRVASYLYFSKGGITQQIVHQIKYKGNKKLAVWCGSLMYKEIQPWGFFEGIDVLVPVPLHPKKEKKRGYNQAEMLVKGLSAESGIPYDTGHLIKVKDNKTQTAKNRYDRWINSKESFVLLDAEYFKNKHILLVDDVLTTGSTLEACATCFKESEGCTLSVLSLAYSY